MGEKIDNGPKTPLEAEIDKATGHKPGDENRVVSDAEQDGQADETKPAEVKEKRDWVKEAYECFIKNAVDLEPTDPEEAVWKYFEKNATDELKAKVKAEGKTAESCWNFIEAVARKALGGSSGHIDPVAVYAIAMHYFQDVPKAWDKAKAEGKTKVKDKVGRVGRVGKVDKSDKVGRVGRVGKVDKSDKVDKVGRVGKAKKRGGEQGFFFDLMETETVGPDAAHGSAVGQDGKEAGDAE